MPANPIGWIVAEYVPHFLRLTSLECYADGLSRLRWDDLEVIYILTEDVRAAVRQRLDALKRNRKVTPVPDDDPVTSYFGGFGRPVMLPTEGKEAHEVMLLAQQVAEIAVGEGKISFDRLRREQQRLCDDFDRLG